MQSSPPMRSLERAASSAESQYSLDLGALDLDAHSDSSDPIPKPYVARIFSEDIDGPSDFTQNMEMWMKGGPAQRGSSKVNELAAAPLQQGELQSDQSAAFSPDSRRVGSVNKNIATNDQRAQQDDPSSKAAETRAMDDEDDASSEWDPYGAASTPALPGRKQFLQPTVEEYYSELTTARQTTPLRAHGRGDTKNTMPQIAAHELESSSPLKHSSSPGRKSSPTLSPVRSPGNQRSSSRSDRRVAGKHQDPEQELLRLYRKCKQLEQMNHALSRVLDDERRMRKLESGDRALDPDAEVVTGVNANHVMHGQREELEGQLMIHDAELERLRMDVEGTYQQEIELADLEHQLRSVRAENERLKDEARESEEDIDALRSQLIKTRQSQGEETSRASDERTKAVELATNLQRQLQDSRKQLRDERGSHEAEIQRLTSSHRKAQESSTQELNLIREEHESQMSKLNEAIIERDEAQDQLRTAQAEAGALKTELVDLKAVNTALDASVRDKMQDRDDRWKEKLEAAHRERRLMSKALLHQWGREEVGTTSPQKYAYRYTPAKTNVMKTGVLL